MQKRYGVIAAAASLILLVGALSSCGGGGGSGNSNALAPAVNAPPGTDAPGNQLPTATDLLVSEVAANSSNIDVAWFEVHNPTNAEISLAGYSLRSSYADRFGNGSLDPMHFTLPPVSVPPNGYLVIAAGVRDDLEDTSQIVYSKSGPAYPSWTHSGSIELLKGGKTVDFVRFGASTAAPVTSNAWTGRSLSALPSSPNDSGSAVVRLAASGMADTNTADDWAFVNFATPGGKNDVAQGVIDSDNDGIPDSAKVPGGTYGGLDVYAMGARPGRRDIFIEIDYPMGDTPTYPRQEVLQKVVDAFAQKNIAVHFDVGTAYSGSFDPTRMNLGGGNPVPPSECVEFQKDPFSNCRSFYEYKSRHFDLRRRFLFHYALFGARLNGPLALADYFGTDMAFAMATWRDEDGHDEVILNMLTNNQAATIMHELGHNLGLHHGGNDPVNYKPNHYSIMNSMYVGTGLSAATTSSRAYERYRHMMGYGSICDLENSPCGKDFVMSYSDGTGADLDEDSLSEELNIGRGSDPGAYADWNLNGSLDSARYAYNLNPVDGPELTVLKDYDEWANLVLPFSRSGRNRLEIAAFGPSGQKSGSQGEHYRVNPMNQRANRPIIEALTN